MGTGKSFALRSRWSRLSLPRARLRISRAAVLRRFQVYKITGSAYKSLSYTTVGTQQPQSGPASAMSIDAWWRYALQLP